MSKGEPLIKGLVVLSSEDALKDIIETTSEQKLVVMDIHQEWSGPCEALHPTLNRVFNDYDLAEERIVFATAAIGKIGEQAILDRLGADHKPQGLQSCTPCFALFRNKACVHVFTGVDAPSIMDAIGSLIPPAPKKAED